jgi:hypothetical protein
MAQISCTNRKNYALTEGKVYESIASENEDFYTIINDSGLRARYAKSLFAELNEGPEDRGVSLQEVLELGETIRIRRGRGLAGVMQDLGGLQAAPVPAPVLENLTEAEQLATVVMTPQGVRFQKSNREVVDLRTNRELAVVTCNISCGVYQIIGIDNIIRRIRSHYPDETEMYKLLIKKAIESKIHNDGESEDGNYPAFYILSTTVDDRDETVGVLDEMSCGVSTVAENPNSGNNIKVWIIEAER